MDTYKYVILGGGMVAGYAAKEFVERGLEADADQVVHRGCWFVSSLV